MSSNEELAESSTHESYFLTSEEFVFLCISVESCRKNGKKSTHIQWDQVSKKFADAASEGAVGIFRRSAEKLQKAYYNRKFSTKGPAGNSSTYIPPSKGGDLSHRPYGRPGQAKAQTINETIVYSRQELAQTQASKSASAPFSGRPSEPDIIGSSSMLDAPQGGSGYSSQSTHIPAKQSNPRVHRTDKLDALELDFVREFGRNKRRNGHHVRGDELRVAYMHYFPAYERDAKKLKASWDNYTDSADYRMFCSEIRPQQKHSSK